LKYLLDANTYIEAKNRYYGMDFCPAYWDWLDAEFETGNIASIDAVRLELEKGNKEDELRIWCKSHRAHFIANNDAATQTILADIVNYLMTHEYNVGNRDGFIQGADPWLIAKAKASGATVVSHEAQRVPQTKKVKVPNICAEFGVPCITTFELLRILNARFVSA